MKSTVLEVDYLGVIAEEHYGDIIVKSGVISVNGWEYTWSALMDLALDSYWSIIEEDYTDDLPDEDDIVLVESEIIRFLEKE